MIQVWFDGCCEPKNPGGWGTYGLFIARNGCMILSEGELVGSGPKMSNNFAEYSGFLRALIFLKEKGYDKEVILVRGDSKLVIEQMFGKWRIRRGLYVSLAFECQRRLEAFSNMNGQWIPRDQNDRCDKLAKDVLRAMKIKFMLQPE